MPLAMILIDVEEVLRFLRAGDTLTLSAPHTWTLTTAQVLVHPDIVAVLRSGDPFGCLGGELAPAGDQLPGMPKYLSQTWRWAETRSRAKH